MIFFPNVDGKCFGWSWSKYERGQSALWTLNLTVSQEWTDGINWCFACWYKFTEIRSWGGQGQIWVWPVWSLDSKTRLLSRKVSHSAKFEGRPQMFLTLSFRELIVWFWLIVWKQGKKGHISIMSVQSS